MFIFSAHPVEAGFLSFPAFLGIPAKERSASWSVVFYTVSAESSFNSTWVVFRQSIVAVRVNAFTGSSQPVTTFEESFLRAAPYVSSFFPAGDMPVSSIGEEATTS